MEEVNKEYLTLIRWVSDFKTKFGYVNGASQVVRHADAAVELFEKIIGKPKSLVIASSPVVAGSQTQADPLAPKYVYKVPNA